jgi:foldase protein PrsA
MALLVTGCGKVAKLANGEEVVASIDGEDITADELYTEIKDKYARDQLINMIDTIILNKVYKTDETMTSYVSDQIDYYEKQLGDSFLSTIKSQLGLNSIDEFSDYLLLNYKRNEAIDDYVATIITEADINTYYEEKTVGDIRASHILIKPDTTDNMTDTEKATKKEEALALANEILTKLNNGEDFAALAKEYSDDSGSAKNGGDLGWFNKGDMTEAFEEAAYALEVDAYSKTPVETSYGYHIILKTGVKDKATLEQSKDDIIEAITDEKLAVTDNTLSYEALVDLRQTYKLNIQDSELKKQYDEYMDELLGA